jgi:hypothetical protein
MRRGFALRMAAFLALGLPAFAQEAALTTVTMGDGSTVLLRSWQLVYDVQTWPKGQPPTLAGSQSVTAAELWSGKKRHPLAGQVLEPVTGVGGFTREVKLQPAGGKLQAVRLEQPARELLTPDLDKDVMSMARSVDLVGETLTGTRRSFCLLSFTALVTCPTEPENRVAKVEFAP